MKQLLPWTPGVLFLLFNFLNPLQAQQIPENPPPGRNGGEGGKPDKGFRDFRDKEGRGIRPEPILMAGDPRFQNMLLLATTPPEKLEEKMKNWPAFAEMNEERREQMKKELEGFRNRIFRAAMKNAEESGLNLSEEQKPDYVRRYWERRSRVETPLRNEVQERLKVSMEQENAALKKEFSKPTMPVP